MPGATRACARPRSATPCIGCSSSSICARPVAPDVEIVRDVVPRRHRRGARADRDVRRVLLRVRARARGSRRSTASGPSGRSRSSTTACCCTGGSMCSGATVPRALVLDYKTNSLGEGTPEEIVEADYRLQRLVYALACFRAGADEVEVVYHFLERPDAVVATTFDRVELPGLEAGAVGGDRAHRRRRVRADAERVHVLRLPGARPRLRRPEAAPAAGAAVAAACGSVRARPRSVWCYILPMPRSYVAEARRKKVAPKKERIRPIIERLAVEHADAKIALTYSNPLELLVSVMLSRADDRRERQPRHARSCSPSTGGPRTISRCQSRSSSGTSSRPGFYRQKAKSLRGTMQRLIEEHDGEVPERLRRAAQAPGRRAQDGERRLGGARQRAGIVVDTHVRRLSQRLGLTQAGGPGEDRARPDEARPARRLGAFPAPADLARPPHLRRAQAALRGLSARRGSLPVERASDASHQRPRATRVRGVSATSRPPSSSYAGKTSAMTGFSLPARVRIESCSPSRRTPHSRARSTGFASENCSASTTSRPIRSASGKPVSSNTPRPIASTRRSWSVTSRPVSGAG